MTKKLSTIGNSAGIIIDKPILELLKITQDTELDLSTDGERLIITPIHGHRQQRPPLKKAQEAVLKQHSETFRKLAK